MEDFPALHAQMFYSIAHWRSMNMICQICNSFRSFQISEFGVVAVSERAMAARIDRMQFTLINHLGMHACVLSDEAEAAVKAESKKRKCMNIMDKIDGYLLRG